jgi:hypothetical protein
VQQTGGNAIRRPQIGSSLPATVQNQDLVSHQHGFGNNGTEPARPSKPDNGGNGMQKKSKNVARSEDGIKRKKLKNSRRFRNSPPTPWSVEIGAGASLFFADYFWSMYMGVKSGSLGFVKRPTAM